MLREIINKNIVGCEPHNRVAHVARLMERYDVGAVIVMQNGRPMGIVTDRDIVVRCLGRSIDPEECLVETVMSRPLVTCRETDGVFDCIKKMKQAKIRRIPVVDDMDKVIGVISFGDLLSVLSKEFSNLVENNTAEDEVREFDFAA